MSAAQSNEQYAKAFDLLQGAEAELRGAAEERRTYTKSLDTIQFRMSRMDLRAARTDANVTAIVKHFGIKLPSPNDAMNGSAKPPRPSQHSANDDEAYEPEDEVTLHGRKIPVINKHVPLTKSDFEMLKKTSALARLGMGIGEKVLVAFGASVLLALATLTGAWVHAAYIDAKHFAEPVPHIAPALDRIG